MSLRWIVAVIAILGVCAVSGCSHTEDVASAQPAPSHSGVRRAFEREASRSLEASSARLDSVRSEMLAHPRHLGDSIVCSFADLEGRRDHARQCLARLRLADGEEWTALRISMTGILDSLDERVRMLHEDLRHSQSG